MKILLLLLAAISFPAQAKQFEIFDGRIYNGKFYPLVDIIEWGEQYGNLPHIEFHIHSKANRVELSVEPGERNGRPVLWIMYDLQFRGERVCRHVLAPAHFREGMKLYAYRDLTDPDYDNIYISSEPKTGKNMVPYEMPAYEPCLDPNASNKPDSLPRSTASTAAASPEAVSQPAEKKDGKNIGHDYDNHAVPFSF